MKWPLTIPEATVVISIFSATVALSAAAVAFWFASRNFSREVLNQRLGMMTTELKYFEDFQKWAVQTADALTEAIHLCDLDPKHVQGESFFDRRHRLRITISTLIDRGRWFFPNIEVDDHGTDKEPGYRGYRHELLDGLVSAYRLLPRLDYANKGNNGSVRGDLTACKRHFVGQVQNILDPSKRQTIFDQIRAEVN